MRKLVHVAMVSLLLNAGSSMAQQVTDFGDEDRLGNYDIGNLARFSLAGFGVGEYGRSTNRSEGLVNCQFTPDPRGVFGSAIKGGPFCQPGPSGNGSGPPLNLFAVTAALAHEFDSAWKIDGKISTRTRDSKPDIYGNTVVEKNFALSHPVYGEVRFGTQLSRSWSRSDSFTYPLGMSSAWAETGAGYGLLKEALRYTSAPIEILGSKLVLEGTYATNSINFAHNADAVLYNEEPPRPKLGEIFVQYANDVNLIELIWQNSRGGAQSSFAKGAFVGDVGNADNIANYSAPHQNVVILQGDHYFSPSWKLTLGAKRSFWSGEMRQCDYVTGIGCYFSTEGFSNDVNNAAHPAKEYDFMGGISYIDGIWTYTGGFVRYSMAYTKTPTEWGQSNTADYLHVGLYRQVPEISQHLQVYGGVGILHFGSKNPAPMSLPNELANFGVDPRDNSGSVSATIGVLFKF